MRINRERYVCGWFLSLVALLAMAGSAQAGVRVGGWSLRANGQLARDFQYSGSCPVDLKFGWGVIGTEPTTVAYSFVRNDGGHSPSSTAELPRANQSVPIYDEWQLGANTPQFANYRGWVQLNIQSPNPVSQRIGFTLHCNGGTSAGGGGGTVRVGGYSLRANGQLAKDFQYSGSCPVPLKFGWGVIGTEPTTITYSFVRSDGGHSSDSRSTELPRANQSVPIYYDWNLGTNNSKFANFSGWVQMNIESPNPVSQKISFTLHCGNSPM